MIVKIDRSFEKDVDALQNAKIYKHLFSMIESVKNAKSIEAITGIKKLKGSKKHYRIRIGDYRAGLIIDGNTVAFTRFLHRKDIYKRFP